MGADNSLASIQARAIEQANATYGSGDRLA
jgi:hypothetical protein